MCEVFVTIFHIPYPYVGEAEK